MAKGISLHIGIRSFDPEHYAGNNGFLFGPEYDADDMRNIAHDRGFSTYDSLLTSINDERLKATKKNVERLIKDAATKLSAGDMFMLTYSGHGGRLPNLNGDGESGSEDQTWCLYDSQLIDDQLKRYLGLFAEGVRILVVSDSCYSGSIIKKIGMGGPKTLDKSIFSSAYTKNKAFYDSQLRQPNILDSDIKASVLLFSACMDTETTLDEQLNGEFTKLLKTALRSSDYNASYQLLAQRIRQKSSQRQQPQFKKLGMNNPNFNENSRPFQI